MEYEVHGESYTITMPQHFAGALVKSTLVEIHRLFETGTMSDLTLDFTSTELVDSQGIGTLVSLAKESHCRKIGLVLKNLCDDLFQLFGDTGLDRIFTIERRMKVVQPSVSFFKSMNDIKLSVEKEFFGTVVLFRLKGFLNHPTGSGRFKQELLLSFAQYKKIVLDLEELTFIDSLSLSAVLRMNTLLTGTGGRMAICGANHVVQDLFSTLGIGSIIPIFSSREEALDSMEGSDG